MLEVSLGTDTDFETEGAPTVKIHIMTDLEGCAGVLDAKGFIYRDSRYYEQACELATLEVSAAVEGALEAGATEVLVVDGHGAGAMKRELLHPAAKLMAGRFPPNTNWGLDGTFTAAMIVGQHAKANTNGAHLAHTMSFAIEQYTLNDMPIGEMGLCMLQAGYFGVPTIFLSGDQAACDEARSLVPNIETAAVKEGVTRGSASGLSAEENEAFNSCGIHLHPDRARALIREHAYRAVQRIPEFAPFCIDSPYTLTRVLRPEPGKKTGKQSVVKAKDFLDLLALPTVWKAKRTTTRKRAASKRATPKKVAAVATPKKPAKKTPKKKVVKAAKKVKRTKRAKK